MPSTWPKTDYNSKKIITLADYWIYSSMHFGASDTHLVMLFLEWRQWSI